nr:MAG TPA: Chromatin remodeling complex ATPase [Caudoviricetes sp.]
MKIRIAKSRKQPVLNSVYVSGFGQPTLDLLKASKPFTTYHKDLKEYEITPSVLAEIKEPVTQVINEELVYNSYKRTHLEKYGYQEDAIDFANSTKNVFLNFPQGMGKSLTTMKILVRKNKERVLIICGQGNLQEEWIKDAIKHDYRDKLRMGIVGDDTGAGNPKKLKWLAAKGLEAGTDLINIEALRKAEIVQALNLRNYQCIVVDEVQSAKGWKSDQTEGLHDLVRWEGQDRIALSGTPVLNNPLEYFSMLKYFNMLEDTARTTFEKYYGEWGFDYWGHYVCKGYKNLKDLNELIAHIVCYAHKEELNLPEKHRKVIQFEWYSEEFEMLKRLYKLSSSRLKRAGYDSKPQVRARMQYLSAVAQPKIDFVNNLAKDKKVLVFSQYTTVLEKYCYDLAANGRKVLYYHGGLGMKERLDVLSKWRTGDYDVLLLSTMSARYGLNLTEATNVVFVDLPPSFAILEQAEDRAHRIGQTQEVYSYLLSCSEVDVDARDNIVRKQQELEKLNKLRGA